MSSHLEYFGKLKSQLNYMTIALAFVSGTGFYVTGKLFRTNSYLLNRLNEKSYIFAPSDGKVQLIKINQITENEIKNKVKEIIQIDSNLSRDIRDANLSYMTTYLNKIIVAKYIDVFQSRIKYLEINNASEFLKTISIVEFKQVDNLNYEVIADIETNILVSNKVMGTKEEKVSLSIEILPPSENSPWNYTINKYNRYSKDSYNKLFNKGK